MTEIKSRLQGGVQEKKKLGAERLKAVLEEIKTKGIVTEGELAKSTGLDKKALGKYVAYLKDNGLISVKRKWFFGEAEISISGGRNVRIPVKRNVVSDEEKAVLEKAQEQLASETPDTTDAPIEEPQLAKTEKAVEPQPLRPQETPPKPPAPAGNGQKPSTAQASPSGEKLVPETEEELREVCKSLVTDFVGVMRLYGESQEDSYTAGLLIDKGDIVAASFEHMDTVDVLFGDKAMHELQTRFSGTRGNLEIFEMSEDDLNESIRSNINYMLTAAIKLSALNIRIKSNIRPETQQEKKSVLSGISNMFSQQEPKTQDDQERHRREAQKRRVERITGGLNLVDFARNLKIDPLKAKRFEELRKARQKNPEGPAPILDPKKAARLEELKMQKPGAIAKNLLEQVSGSQTKEERLEKLRQTKKPVQITAEKEDKVPVKTVQEGKKIATTIDKLYELVEAQGRIKLNDALAAKLKVSKTQIEEWAMILEEHSLMELKYPTIGEPELISKKGDKNPKEKT